MSQEINTEPFIISCEYSEESIKELTLMECIDSTVNPLLKSYGKPLRYDYRPKQFSNYIIIVARSHNSILGFMCGGIKPVLINNQPHVISIGMDGRIKRSIRNKGLMKVLFAYVSYNFAQKFNVEGLIGCSSPKTLPSAHLLGMESESRANQGRQRIDLIDKQTMKAIGIENKNVRKLSREESVLVFEKEFKNTRELYPLDLKENIVGNSLFKGTYILSNEDGSCTVGASIWQSSLIYSILNVGENVTWPVDISNNNNSYNLLFGIFGETSSKDCNKLMKSLFSHIAYITLNEPSRHNLEGALNSSIVTDSSIASSEVYPNYLLSCCQYANKLSDIFNDWPIHWDDRLVGFNPLQPNCPTPNNLPYFFDPRELGNILYSPEPTSSL